MEKVIIEVGSTCTKIDFCTENEIKHLATETIQFKKNYTKLGKLDPMDVERLIKKVNEIKKVIPMFMYVERVFFALYKKRKENFFCKCLKFQLDWILISFLSRKKMN